MEKFWVVRKANGRFVRGFVHEWQAQRWVENGLGKFYRQESPNAQGGFEKVSKA